MISSAPEAHEHIHDFQCLLAGIRLGDQQRIGVDAQLLGVFRIQRVLGIDECRDAAGLLCAGDCVQGNRGLARRFRTIDLHHAAAWQSANAKGGIQGNRAGRDYFNGCAGFVAQAHDRAFAIGLVNLAQDSL